MTSSSHWRDIGVPLSEPVLKTLAKLNFQTMTPVQASAIPLFLSKKDVAAEAVTGSGKTLAFVIPIVETLLRLQTPLKKCEIGALIVSPTRELASQISEVLQSFLDEIPTLTQMLFIGGRNIAADFAQFEEVGANIIVGTPGRLEDILLGKTKASATIIRTGLKSLEMLVLDEADRLLSLGFENAINTIMSCLPKLRRTGLFSATQTKDVEKLIRAGLRNPVLLSVKEKPSSTMSTTSSSHSSSSSTPSTLINHYLICEHPEQKFATLFAFLRDLKPEERKVMLFFSTCASVEYFSLVLGRLLHKEWKNMFAIHGKKAKRNEVFEEFRKADEGLLACTDVMARGIDIPEVHWVIQFDPPSNAEAFVHRCGRTARIGHEGAALLLLLPSEDAYIEFIKLNQKVTLHPTSPPNNIPNLLSQLRSWQRNDRSIFDKATRAFVSSVQAYSKHECKYVLRLKDLPFGSLATAFGLLRMPKMPELRNKKVTGFVEDKGQNMNDIKYKDKQKEKSRQDKLKVFQETGHWPGSKVKVKETQSWSDKFDKRGRRDLRKMKKELKRKADKPPEREEKDHDDVDEDNDEDDLEELEKDYRMLKKIKRGKVSHEAFDKHIDLDQIETDEEEVEQDKLTVM